MSERFIQLTEASPRALPVYIKRRSIIVIQEIGTYTSLELSNGEYWKVAEDLGEIMMLLEDDDD